MSIQNVISNINYLMDSKRMTANQLQNYVGVDQSTISQIIKGKTKNPSLDTLQQIAKFFGYNAADLMNVDLKTGQSVKEGLNDIAHYEIKERLKLGFHDKSELVRIPYLDAAVACGRGFINSDYIDVLGYYEMSEDFLIQRGLPKDGDGLILVRATGDSMAPTIVDEAPLLVYLKEREYSQLISGKIYVFCMDNQTICKRVFKNFDGSIILKSDNPAFQDMTIGRDSFDNINVLGRVRYAFIEF